MTVAKRTRIGEKRYTVKDFMTGRKIKVECEACYNEEGSYACIRPSHNAWKDKQGQLAVADSLKRQIAKIVQDEEVPIEKPVLAAAIVAISDAMKKLEKSGLNRKGVIALINDDTKLGKGIIETVLFSLENLAKTYTK